MNFMRQSNIELLRIISMMLVLLVHSTYASFGTPSTWETNHYGLIIASAFSVIGVNVFVLISGWFSIRLSKKSFAKILFPCLFYGLIIAVFAYFDHDFSIKQCLFVSNANWFISAYLGLLVISPLLNAFVDKSSQRELLTLIVVLLVFQTWYEYIPKLIPDFHAGYSILSFAVLYLIARYLRLYEIGGGILRKRSLLIYLAISFIITVLVSGNAMIGCSHLDYIHGKIMNYNNPLLILSAVCFFLTFEKRKIKNNIIINRFAASAIAVLLLHTSSVMFKYYSGLLHSVFYNTSGFVTAILWLVIIVSIYAACTLVDQIRLFLQKRIVDKFVE